MTFTQFECIYGVLSIHNTSINICAFYRPPPTERNGLSTSKFIDEWRDFMSEQSVLNAEVIIVNDHYALTLKINETFQKSSYKTVSYRKLRDINVETFKQDIRN